MRIKRAIATLTALVLSITAAWAQETTKNVLFVGNSYTEVNNLPLLIQRVARSMGDSMTYQSHTPGGCTLRQHCTNTSMELIRQGQWDVVVLQEQSQYPSFPQSQVEQEVFPYAARLVDSIYAYAPCAEPMFYLTWGRKNGDAQNAPYFPVLATYEGMDSMLYERYIYMAQTNDASLCPVGRVWRYLRTHHPAIELYASDESHPSMAGSYAAACAFYALIFRRSPLLITYNAGLDSEVATTIRRAADSVAFQTLSQWQRPTPQAAFDYEGDSVGLPVRFHNNSTHADAYQWSFGDGTESTLAEPSHIYTAAGSYLVTLTATRHCMSSLDSSRISVVERNAFIDMPQPTTVTLYPNPATTHLTLQATTPSQATLYDMKGRAVWSARVNDVPQRFVLPNIAAGTYLLRVATTTHRIIIQ